MCVELLLPLGEGGEGTAVVLRDYKYIDRSLLTDYLSSIDPGIITEVRDARGGKHSW
jgi:hypothetical protein